MSKVLLLDLETAPNLGWTWGKYEQNVIAFEREDYLLCFAYRWLGEKKTHVIALPDLSLYQEDPTNDRELVTLLHSLFDAADIIIAHNGDGFDIKKSNGRFLLHGLLPPSPYKTVDTLKIARGMFKLNSNKLDDLGKFLNVGCKVTHEGFGLWKKCMAGDPDAWNRMKKYNKQDVDLLMAVYERLRGWKKGHPSLTLDQDLDRPTCSTCTSPAVQKAGFEHKPGGMAQRWKCQACGANLYTTKNPNLLKT